MKALSLSVSLRAFLVLFALSFAEPASAQSPPNSFQWTVSFSGTSYTADFEIHSARGPNFAIEVQQADGSFVTHTPGPLRTYIGTIAGLPGAMASALRRADGSTYYHVLFEDGAEWINNGGGTSLRDDAGWTPNYPSLVTGSGGAGQSTWAAEVGMDLPFSQYSVDGDVDAAVEMIEHSINTVNLLYLRDACILHRLGRVVVRADAAQDPYAGMTSTGPLLTEVRNQWNNVLAPSTHDIGLVATSATGGGLASVGVVGNPGYSSNGSTAEGDFTIVWRHEAGHNWSMSHFDGGTPEGRTINSGNAMSRMSGAEQAKAVAHRDARTAFLDNLGPYIVAIPPRASLDRHAFLPQSGASTIDVLDNDHDANGDALNIVSFDMTSALGGTVALSAGTGPGGRDELLYTPPAFIGSEPDSFSYRIADSLGRQGLGNVVTRLTSDTDLLAHFTMDAGSGSTVEDSSSYARDAEFSGGPVWDVGTIGGGITFDGVDDRLLANAIDRELDTFTITGWIKRNGPQADWSGIVFSRGGTTASGLNFGTNDELRYHWDGGHWPWNSGLVVPDDTWTFVALAVSPTAATIYMDAGSGLQSATNFGAHNLEAFDAGLTVGRDPHSGSRTFNGTMDDMRVFGRTLNLAEITALANGLGSASEPNPDHLATSTAANLSLSWTSSPAATGHRVYFSSVYTDVRDGDPSADQGLVSSSLWNTPCLSDGAWYWRVDSTDGVNWVEGPVWSFAISERPSAACFPYLCNGDGGDQMGCTDCPCGNNAPAGTIGGCRNSFGVSAMLTATGDASVSLPSGANSDIRFALQGAPPNAFSILNSGDAVAPQGAMNPCMGLNTGAQAMAFDGLRCGIQNTQRHGGRAADATGQVGVTNNPWGGEGGPPAGIAVAGGGFAAGQTRYFQVIHRDDPALGCGRGLNTSQAVEVAFTP